jgi:anthranilate synthase/aminodeoxychorismate synthase-like glutamine amidotransferase
MVLLIDNYDSFVFNLARYVEELGVETRVVRNDAITIADIRRLKPQALILSPGPCGPDQSGVCLDVIRHLSASTPTLGVCLGHQAIAAALEGRVVRAAMPVHGRSSLIIHPGSGLFEGLPSPLTVGRYHSLVAEPASLPKELEVTARTEDGIVMSLQHRTWPLWGVQFHPESVLTAGGHRLLANFLRMAGARVGECPEGDLPQGNAATDFYTQPIQWP